MSKFLIKQCPVCDQNLFVHSLTTTDFFISGEEFEIKQCTGCGLKFTANSEDEDGIEKYYNSEDYISHSNTGKGIINSLYHLIRRYMLNRKRKIVERITDKKNGKLLDIGAGTAYFLMKMKNHGWTVTGTEKNAKARKLAKNKFGVDLHSPEAIFEMPSEEYDTITLWHVLEHIHRINENMETFFRLLKPDGKLIIAVPNRSSYDARHYRKYWAAWDVPRHIWHFSPFQIQILGKKHKFNLIRTYNMPFDSFYISILSERYKKSKFPLLKGLLFGKLSWLIGLSGEDRGSSVIYVFEKQE